MAIHVKLDPKDKLSSSERNGTITEVHRAAIVTGLKDYASDWNVMSIAMTHPDVPQYGNRLSNNPNSQVFTLVVVDRDINMVDEDCAVIDLVYKNAYQIDAMEDRFDSPFLGIIGGEVRCNVQQVYSNLAADGSQVVVEHTYPEDDANFPGETKRQGGEFTYFTAQRSFAVHGIKQTNAPWAIANNINGRVNYYPFSGEAPRTWLCVGASWKPESLHNGLARYYMRFEFQHNLDTWDPTVVFIDPVENKPPPDLVAGVGYKTIQKIPAVDFEYIIGAWIHGA